MDESFTLNELCRMLGKSPRLLLRFHSRLELPPVSRGCSFPRGYIVLMEKVILLQAFTVPMEEIADLFAKELKILHLLNCDVLDDSPYWFLLGITGRGEDEQRLLLTGYNVGFPLTTKTIQTNLVFRKREAELFNGPEMGEDVYAVMQLYLELLRKVKSRIDRERPVLKNALAWSQMAFRFLT